MKETVLKVMNVKVFSVDLNKNRLLWYVKYYIFYYFPKIWDVCIFLWIKLDAYIYIWNKCVFFIYGLSLKATANS